MWSNVTEEGKEKEINVLINGLDLLCSISNVVLIYESNSVLFCKRSAKCRAFKNVNICLKERPEVAVKLDGSV